MTKRKTIRLSEITRYKEEIGENFPRWQEELVKYEEQGGYFIHFSNVPRIGLYIVNKYNTPIGFYAYPLDRDKMESFAIDRPYAIIFKPKPEANILEIKKYSESDYKADIAKLVDMGNSLEVIEKAASKAKRKTPAGKIWNVTRVLSGSDKKTDDDSVARGGGATGKWSILFKKLGYDGVNDDCLSIIHDSEPCQAVFFDTSKLDLVKVIELKSSNIKDVDQLFDTEEREYQRKITLAKTSSPKLLASLAQDSDWKIRKVVAGNENAPPEVLKSLLFDTDSVRVLLAKNKKSPEDLLVALANDRDFNVRMAVVNNNSATPKVLASLAKLDDLENTTIRILAVNHLNVTPEVLTTFSKDPAETVRSAVARNEDTPGDVLAELAKQPVVRIAVAGNRNTPQEVLRYLADDSTDPLTREAVADNPKVPRDILEKLAKDSDNFVRRSAFQRLSGLQEMTQALVMEKVLWKLIKRKL